MQPGNSAAHAHTHTHTSKVRQAPDLARQLRVTGSGSPPVIDKAKHTGKAPHNASAGEGAPDEDPTRLASTSNPHGHVPPMPRSTTPDASSVVSADYVRLDSLANDFTPSSSMKFDGYRSSIGGFTENAGGRDEKGTMDGRRVPWPKNLLPPRARNSPDPLPLGYRQNQPAYTKFVTSSVEAGHAVPDKLRSPLPWSDRDSPSPVPLDVLDKADPKTEALLEEMAGHHRPMSRIRQGFKALEDMNAPFRRNYSKEVAAIREHVNKDIDALDSSAGDASDQLKRARGIYDRVIRSVCTLLMKTCQDHAEILRFFWDDFGKYIRGSDDEKGVFKDRLRKASEDKKRLEFECSRLKKILDDFKQEKREYAAYIRSQKAMVDEANALREAILVQGTTLLTVTNQAIWATLPILNSGPSRTQPTNTMSEADDSRYDPGLVVSDSCPPDDSSRVTKDVSTQTKLGERGDGDCQTEIIGNDMLMERFRLQTDELLKSWISDDWGIQLSMEDDILRSELMNGGKKSGFDGAPSWIHILPKKRTPEILSLVNVESVITDIYNDYFTKFILNETPKNARPTISDFTLKYHYLKFGKRATEKLQDMIYTTIQNADSSLRCQWFIRFCRMPNLKYSPLLNKYFQIFIQILIVLVDGGTVSRGIRALQGNASGRITIPITRANKIIEKFAPDSLNSKDIQQQLGSEMRLPNQNGGESADEQFVDFDKFTAFIMQKWISENEKRQHFLRSAFHAADGDRNKCIDKDELWIIAKLFDLDIPEKALYDVFHGKNGLKDGMNIDIFTEWLEERLETTKLPEMIQIPEETKSTSLEILRKKWIDLKPTYESVLNALELGYGILDRRYKFLNIRCFSFQMLLVEKQNAESAWLSYYLLNVAMNHPLPNWDSDEENA